MLYKNHLTWRNSEQLLSENQGTSKMNYSNVLRNMTMMQEDFCENFVVVFVTL